MNQDLGAGVDLLGDSRKHGKEQEKWQQERRKVSVLMSTGQLGSVLMGIVSEVPTS